MIADIPQVLVLCKDVDLLAEVVSALRSRSYEVLVNTDPVGLGDGPMERIYGGTAGNIRRFAAQHARIVFARNEDELATKTGAFTVILFREMDFNTAPDDQTAPLDLTTRESIAAINSRAEEMYIQTRIEPPPMPINVATLTTGDLADRLGNIAQAVAHWGMEDRAKPVIES